MRLIAAFILVASMSCAVHSAEKAKPREKYFRGDVVELAVGPKAVVIDKRYNSIGGWIGWYYTVRYNSPTGLQSVEIMEPEIEKCLKDSPTRPQAEKQG